MKIVMKCDMGGYIIELEKYKHKQVNKQMKYNTIAKFLRDYAQKLTEKAEELEKKTGFNEYLQSFKDKNFISMGFIDPEIKKEADNLVKDKATNKLNARRKAEKRLQIRAYKKEVGCSACGYKDNPDILHFHHKDPTTKLNNISRMLGKNHSMEKIKQEIDKCDLLCITCHHKEHKIK